MDVVEFLVIFIGLFLVLAVTMTSGAGVITRADAGIPAWGQPAAGAMPDGWQPNLALLTLPPVPVVAPAPAGRPNPTSEIPPMYLYHGTAIENLDSIATRGIEGRSAGWAFMATDYGTASGYARSRGRGPGIVLRIRAQQAYQNGVRFEKRGSYFVAQSLHPGHVDFHWSLVDHAERLRGRQNVVA